MTWLRLAPYAAIALLLAAFFWQRGEAIHANAKAESAEKAYADVLQINKNNEVLMKSLADQRQSNDALFNQLFAAKQGNEDRATNVRVELEREANNDPAINNWLDSPVPIGVRRAAATGN